MPYDETASEQPNGSGPDALQILLNDSFKKAEDFIKANPVPVAIGVAATGALIALAIATRRPSERTLQRDLMRAVKRQTDEIAQTVKQEARRLSHTDTADALARILSQADVQKTVTPWVNQLFELIAAGRDRASDTVRNLAK